jgi:branched-chain amino acid transport system substrate-binding protein
MRKEFDTPLGRATHLVQSANRAAGTAPRYMIGLLTPLTNTGWVAAGETIVRGACLAADYVRERGGLRGGRQLELVLEDDQATATRESMSRSAVGGMAKLAVMDDVLAVLGQCHVRTTPAVVELSERLGIPHFVTSGHPDVTAQRYRTVFRTCDSTMDRAKLMMGFMQAEGARRIAILAPSCLFGKTFADALQSIACCDVLRLDYDQETAVSVRRELCQIQAWQPDFIVNLGVMVHMTAPDVIAQAAEFGLLRQYPMMVALPFPNAAPDYWRRLGSAGNLILWPTSQPRLESPGLTSIGHWFLENYLAKYGELPSEMALTAFTDVAIIAQALEWVRFPTREGLIESLESGTFQTWRGPLRFERGPAHWHHSPPALQLMQYHVVGQSFSDAAIVYPHELKTQDYIAPRDYVAAPMVASK